MSKQISDNPHDKAYADVLTIADYLRERSRRVIDRIRKQREEDERAVNRLLEKRSA